jgi:hypothetical protein
MSFIKVHTKNYIVMHGYDHHNKEVEERVEVENTTEKIIAVHRIQSITEKFILIDFVNAVLAITVVPLCV